MRKHLLLLILVCASLRLVAYEYQSYQWDLKPKLDTLTVEEKREGGVVMFDKRIVEHGFSHEGPLAYLTRHVIIRLNSHYAIEYYNKVYVPMTDVLYLTGFKARFVSKDGKVHNMNTNNVKDIANYNNNGPFKIYALEGIEIGGQVEYMYTVKKRSYGFGTEIFRDIYDYRAIEVDVYSPPHIRYESKSYNGLMAMHEADSTEEDYGDMAHLTLRVSGIKAYVDEAYSFAQASYPRIEYKMVEDTTIGKQRLNTWDDAATLFYNVVYTFNGDEQHKAGLRLKKMGDKSSMTIEERIRMIENYVKSHFTIRSDAEGARYETVRGILKSRVASDVGIMRLYGAFFGAANIQVQLVLTSNRINKPFDKDFDSWTYLQQFLIYFPQVDNFIAPTHENSRYGFLPPELCGQEGMFIRKSAFQGDPHHSFIKWINSTAYDQNLSTLNVALSFDLETGLANVKSTHTYTGHAAAFIQPYLDYMSSEDATEAVEGILSAGAHDARPRNLVYSGYKGSAAVYREPFSVSGDFTTNSFLEKTCDAWIFKIGEIIGTQYNLYEEEERRTDVTLYYPHGMRREITFEIPEGYKVTNLDALNSDVRDDSTSATMLFRSSYTQTGNSVSVVIEESYHQIKYPVEMYDDFSAVMNASADFNKVVLFFEKE